MPAECVTPIVAIGPGTGIAPLRALVHERLAQRTKAAPNEAPALGTTLVIAGCRYREKDCLYGREWERWACSPDANLTFVVAASRDQEHKVYVQDKIREMGAHIWDVLGPQRGIAYLCGASGRMPEQVRQSVISVFAEQGHMSEEQATRYFATLESERRWQEECW